MDANGDAYIVGWTDSTDFPTTVGAFDREYNEARDAFMTRLSATGSSLVYSTYLGGSGADVGHVRTIRDQLHDLLYLFSG